MVTLEELENDPWSTYPVSKGDLRELLNAWEFVHRYEDIGPLEVKVIDIFENTDGTADISLHIGREAVVNFISEGLLSCIKSTLEDLKRKSSE